MQDRISLTMFFATIATAFTIAFSGAVQASDEAREHDAVQIGYTDMDVSGGFDGPALLLQHGINSNHWLVFEHQALGNSDQNHRYNRLALAHETALDEVHSVIFEWGIGKARRSGQAAEYGATFGVGWRGELAEGFALSVSANGDTASRTMVGGDEAFLRIGGEYDFGGGISLLAHYDEREHSSQWQAAVRWSW